MAIVIKKSTGGVAIMRLDPESIAIRGEELTLEWALHDFNIAHPGLYVSHREIPDEAIPTDKTYREAWDDVTPEPVIDIDQAKVNQIKKQAVLNQISALEYESKLNRGQRETEVYENLPFHAERIAARKSAELGTTVTAEMVLAQNVYYNKLKALEDQIKLLRGQLGTFG